MGCCRDRAVGVCFRVCTVQYFVWYFCLLPLVLPASRLGPRDGAWLFAGWGGAQLLWLAAAGALEMGGKAARPLPRPGLCSSDRLVSKESVRAGVNTFLQIWGAGLLFLAAHIHCLRSLCAHHQLAPALRDDGSLAPLPRGVAGDGRLGGPAGRRRQKAPKGR